MAKAAPSIPIRENRSATLRSHPRWIGLVAEPTADSCGLFRALGITACGAGRPRRRLAEIGVEPIVPDRKREIVRAGLAFLLAPDAAALDETAAGRTAQHPMGGRHRIVVGRGFHRDVEIEGQGRDRPGALGGAEVDGADQDAVRGRWVFPCLVLQRR